VGHGPWVPECYFTSETSPDEVRNSVAYILHGDNLHSEPESDSGALILYTLSYTRSSILPYNVPNIE